MKNVTSMHKKYLKYKVQIMWFKYEECNLVIKVQQKWFKY